MKFSKEIDLYGVIISFDNLKKLFVVLDKYYPNYKINIKNSKGLDLTNITKDELLNYDFTNSTVVDFAIEARDNNYNYFSLSNTSWGGPRITFDKDEKDTMTLIEGELKEWCDKSSARSGLVKFLHSIWLNIILGVVVVLASIICIIRYPDYISGLILLSTIIFWTFILGLPPAFRYLFPKMEIDLGINKHKKTRHWVWGLLTIVIIPLVLSLVL